MAQMSAARPPGGVALTTDLAHNVVLIILVVSAVWYLATKYARRSSGINVAFAFKEIPPE